MEVQEIIASNPKARVKCTKCETWYDEDRISRDGYWIHHQGFRLDSIIISHIFVCYPCSTYWGRFKSVFVRMFGRLYSKFYLNKRLEKMLGRKLE